MLCESCAIFNGQKSFYELLDVIDTSMRDCGKQSELSKYFYGTVSRDVRMHQISMLTTFLCLLWRRNYAECGIRYGGTKREVIFNAKICRKYKRKFLIREFVFGGNQIRKFLGRERACKRDQLGISIVRQASCRSVEIILMHTFIQDRIKILFATTACSARLKKRAASLRVRA